MPVVSLFSSSNDKPSPFTQAFLFTVIKNVSYYGDLQQQFFPYKDVELNTKSVTLRRFEWWVIFLFR